MSVLCAKSRTYFNRKTYNSMREKTFFITNFMDSSGSLSGPEAWNSVHPLHEERLNKYRQVIYDSKDTEIGTISFGDSLMDGWTKKEFSSVEEEYNFNIGGSWAHHMQQMYTVLIPLMLKNKVVFKNIIIGSLGGNPLLANQPVQSVIDHSLTALNKLRELVPHSNIRIIVYGIPPTVSQHVTKNAPLFESAMHTWVMHDLNAAFLPLQNKLSKWGIFPKAVMSADGVHFTPEGLKIFDNTLVRAENLDSMDLLKLLRIVD